MVVKFTDLTPLEGERIEGYTRRYEAQGYDEIVLLKALVHFFSMELESSGKFFEDYPEARLRFIEFLDGLAPNRTDYSFTIKIAKSCGIERDCATHWLKRYRAWKQHKDTSKK